MKKTASSNILTVITLVLLGITLVFSDSIISAITGTLLYIFVPVTIITYIREKKATKRSSDK